MIHHLRAAGVGVVVDARGPGAPVIVHWGRDLGPLADDELAALADAALPAVPPSSIDEPFRLTTAAGLAEGWTGRPAIELARRDSVGAGATGAPLFGLVGIRRDGTPAGESLVMELRDDDAGVELRHELELTREGVLRARTGVRNLAADPLDVSAAGLLLPVPARAREVLDFTGLWARERRPQRRMLQHGVLARESRHGRGGHDNAFLLVAGVEGFGFESGEVWAVHAAWSGDTAVWAERSALGPTVVAASELLRTGEVVLQHGERYESPWTIAVHSDAGLNGMSARLHEWIRGWPAGPVRPRPLTLNTWEAVYFEQSLDRLEPLVAAAAEVGVERFVLDDGWFLGRRDDRRALGDWSVDPVVWPDGLGPLIERVHRAGMVFGLWVEPEMVSDESELASARPDWVRGRDADPRWRHQRTLDLTPPGAADHVFERLDALLRAYDIGFLKWDHNRDLLHADSHAQTLAAYRLLDRLREAHPQVEIESCASGGARLDLGILPRVGRVWPSDTNDPLERQRIHMWTSLVLPPEYLGAHLGPPRAHTSGRHASLSFRLGTALFGSAGIEWNIAEASAGDRASIAAWAAAYKRLRPLLHTGRVVRVDSPDPAFWSHGVVAQDGSHAVFSVATLGSPAEALPPPLRLPGLAVDARYRVDILDLGGPPLAIADADPPWYAARPVQLSGRVLGETGLAAPLLAPEQVLLLEVTRIDE